LTSGGVVVVNRRRCGRRVPLGAVGAGRLAGKVAKWLSVSHLVGWAPPAANIKVLHLVKLPRASSTAPSVVGRV